MEFVFYSMGWVEKIGLELVLDRKYQQTPIGKIDRMKGSVLAQMAQPTRPLYGRLSCENESVGRLEPYHS